MKVKRKIRSLLVSLLCVMLLAGVLPTAALAEDQIPTDTPRYTTGVSRSKTATPLDTATWTSDVTLSLPSAETPMWYSCWTAPLPPIPAWWMPPSPS